MARGFLSGLFMGGVVSVVGAGLLGVVVFPPQRPPLAPEDVPPAQAAVEQVPQSAAPIVAAPRVAPQSVPQVAPPRPAKEPDLIAPNRPADVARVQTEAQSEIAAPEAPKETVEPAPLPATTARVPSADAIQPTAPKRPTIAPAGAEADDLRPVETTPPILAPIRRSAVPDAASPDVTAALTPVAPVPAPPSVTAPQTVLAPQNPTSPEVATDPATPRAPVAPLPDRTLPVDNVLIPEQTRRATGRALPQIGPPTTSPLERSGLNTPTPVSRNAQQAALDLYAAPFDPAETRPLLGIVLMDQGDLVGESAIGIAALSSFPYPLSFAVDVTLPDARARMDEYRAQGFEVLALVDLPEGMTASETEVSLTAALSALPETVAVLEGPGTGLQGGRAMSDQTSAIMAATGHGIVWRPKGLDTAQKLAARQGVASQTLFRDFDSAGQTPTVIRRFLDQAAFKAGQQGAVIMVGRVRAETISALLLWGLQDRASRVAVAPISVVLKAGLAE